LWFTFDHFENWKSFASEPSWRGHKEYNWRDKICVNAAGHAMRMGVDFILTRDAGLFPVYVFALKNAEEILTNQTNG
jgi:hypothetical protein